MSIEEEVELRDLVAQTLEINGCLPKIRAQLRANIFLALDEDNETSKAQPMMNSKLKTYLDMPEGEVMFGLVREFLEFFDLDFSISVYEPESYLGTYYKYEGRSRLIDKLGLKSTDEQTPGPLLLDLIKIAQSNSKTLNINLSNLNSDKVTESGEISSSSAHSENEVNGHAHSSEDSSEVDAINENHSTNSALKISNENILDNSFLSKKEETDKEVRSNGKSITEDMSASVGMNSRSTANNNNGVTTEEEEEEESSSSESKSRNDKSKFSHKSEKLKSKLDLSPNKSRVSDILPSLYYKDFTDKSNTDVDFDMNNDYEEDFLSGSEVEFSLNKVDCPKPLLEELEQCNKAENNTNNYKFLSGTNNNFNSKSEKSAKSTEDVKSGTTDISESIMEDINNRSQSEKVTNM